MNELRMYPLEEALKAQKALRAAAGLGPEMFPMQAFVGMISDEVDSLRKLGQSDEEIASVIRESSLIEITGGQIAEYYASPEERRQHEEQDSLAARVHPVRQSEAFSQDPQQGPVSQLETCP
jgi:hypothetical protein